MKKPPIRRFNQQYGYKKTTDQTVGGLIYYIGNFFSGSQALVDKCNKLIIGDIVIIDVLVTVWFNTVILLCILAKKIQ